MIGFVKWSTGIILLGLLVCALYIEVVELERVFYPSMALVLVGIVYATIGFIYVSIKHSRLKRFVREFVDQAHVSEGIKHLRQDVFECFKVEEEAQSKGILSSRRTLMTTRDAISRLERIAKLARYAGFEASGRVHRPVKAA